MKLFKSKDQEKKDGYPSVDFLRVRETLLHQQMNTLCASRKAVDEEIIRVNQELKVIADLKDLYATDADKVQQIEEERKKIE